MFCLHSGSQWHEVCDGLSNMNITQFCNGIANMDFLMLSLFLCCSSSVFPAVSLGFIIFGEIFAYVTVFSPTTEVVPFHLHGWCMMAVFLFLAFTCLGHEF